MNCLDTSVLVEIHLGNPKLIHYQNKPFVITDLALSEFCGYLLKKHGEKTGDYWFNKLSSFSYSLSKELLYEAAKFRWKLRHKKMSFVDAATYLFSQKTHCTLITTDYDFQNLPGVEILRK